jgi:hypothetical protein
MEIVVPGRQNDLGNGELLVLMLLKQVAIDRRLLPDRGRATMVLRIANRASCFLFCCLAVWPREPGYPVLCFSSLCPVMTIASLSSDHSRPRTWRRALVPVRTETSSVSLCPHARRRQWFLVLLLLQFKPLKKEKGKLYHSFRK